MEKGKELIPVVLFSLGFATGALIMGNIAINEQKQLENRTRNIDELANNKDNKIRLVEQEFLPREHAIIKTRQVKVTEYADNYLENGSVVNVPEAPVGYEWTDYYLEKEMIDGVEYYNLIFIFTNTSNVYANIYYDYENNEVVTSNEPGIPVEEYALRYTNK